MNKQQAQDTAVAEKPSMAYCPICRKTLPLEPGQPVPKCCGKPMKIID